MMTSNRFVLQKKNENGWRRFVISGDLARHGGTTNKISRAMAFGSETDAEFFRDTNGLTQFSVVLATDDDEEAEIRAFWHQRNEQREAQKRRDAFDRGMKKAYKK